MASPAASSGMMFGWRVLLPGHPLWLAIRRHAAAAAIALSAAGSSISAEAGVVLRRK